MKLSDKDIKDRLATFQQIGLGDSPSSILHQIKNKHIPSALDQALESGHIIIHPMPDLSSALGPSTLDLDLGTKLEIPDIPFEVSTINSETVIRRFVVDFDRHHSDRLILSQHTGISRIDQSWIRFDMKPNEVFELPVGIQVNIFTKQIICVPYDLEANLDGRSKFARKSITTHITSSRFDAGFCGYLTLEVLNGGSCNFNLRPGMAIASIGFHKLSHPASIPYCKKINASFSGQH